MLETNLVALIKDDSLNSPQKLVSVLDMIVDECVGNRRLFSVLLLYLLQLQKQNQNPSERVRRRIIRLRHLLSKIIIDGINCGEFRDIDVKSANDMCYAVIESLIFRLAILNEQTVAEAKASIKLAVEGISIQREQ